MISPSTTMVTLAFAAKKLRMAPCEAMPTEARFPFLRSRLRSGGRSIGAGISTESGIAGDEGKQTSGEGGGLFRRMGFSVKSLVLYFAWDFGTKPTLPTILSPLGLRQ